MKENRIDPIALSEIKQKLVKPQTVGDVKNYKFMENNDYQIDVELELKKRITNFNPKASFYDALVLHQVREIVNKAVDMQKELTEDFTTSDIKVQII